MKTNIPPGSLIRVLKVDNDLSLGLLNLKVLLINLRLPNLKGDIFFKLLNEVVIITMLI